MEEREPAEGGKDVRAHAGAVGRRVRPSLAALVRVSAVLGLVGFGGGISVLGMIRTFLVVRRRWLTEREFTVTATVAQMLPGGAAANALAYTGLRFFGIPGAIAAYAAFIAPGAIIVVALGAAYVHLGVAPAVAPLLDGLNAVVVGIVASITLQMVSTGVSRPWQMAVAAAALLFALAGGASAGETAAFGIVSGLLLDFGTKRMRLARFRRHGAHAPPRVALPEEGAPLAPEPAEAGDDDDLAPPPPRRPGVLGIAWFVVPGSIGALGAMALVFLRAGLGAYGGGFAIIPDLQSTVLAQHWLTAHQFADAVAIGKVSPGPVLLMATFIGYLTHGLLGALAATAAVFAGPILLVTVIGAWLARIRHRRPVRAALRGLTPAVVGVMAAAAVTLGGSLAGPPEFAISAATLLTLTRFRVNPVIVMLLGATARVALHAAGI